MNAPLKNGGHKRKLASWVDAFVEHTSNIDSPEIFRKWSAISAVAAVVEQKVWVTTSVPIYPNIYSIIVGHPGTGKTRAIREARKLVAELKDFHLMPTSVTKASMIDFITEAKRTIMMMPDPPIEYNAATIMVDELGSFMSKYDDELIAVLSQFYDVDPYGENRRGKDLKIKVKKPLLNIICGSTPANLMKFMPENAWDQGFTSRLMLIFSDERPDVEDDFDDTRVAKAPVNKDLLHDLQIIYDMIGQFQATEEYRNAVMNWRKLGEPDVPKHPKLTHYNTRRKVHLYKLSMIAAIERGNQLLLTRDDFNRALGWLLEAEQFMPDIFKASASGTDGRAMDEIVHYIALLGETGVPEYKVVNFARERMPAHAVMRTVEIMERSRLIKCIGVRKDGQRMFTAN